MAELKPCPFCGSKNIRINAYGFGYYAIECLGCGVETARYKNISKYLEGSLPIEKKAEKAIEAWNRGVNPAQANDYEIVLGGFHNG